MSQPDLGGPGPSLPRLVRTGRDTARHKAARRPTPPTARPADPASASTRPNPKPKRRNLSEPSPNIINQEPLATVIDTGVGTQRCRGGPIFALTSTAPVELAEIHGVGPYRRKIFSAFAVLQPDLTRFSVAEITSQGE